MKIMICFLSLLIAGVALAEEIDFISMIRQSTRANLAKDAGLSKLNGSELQNWNDLLNAAFEFGVKNGRGGWFDIVAFAKEKPKLYKDIGIRKLSLAEHRVWNDLYNQTVKMGAEENREVRGNQRAQVALGNPVYVTQIEAHNDDILKLTNGGIVELTGYLGYVGFRKDAVLFKDGYGWKIWVKGKKSFRCQMLKKPFLGVSGYGEKISVFEVKGDGKIITTIAGGIYEVSDWNTFEASQWFGGFEALVIDGERLLNLDEGGEIVEVTKLK